MAVGRAGQEDLADLLQLYTHLHEDSVPEVDERLIARWKEILDDPRQCVIVAREDGKVVSSCVLVIVPNLTRGQRPYALIENVVTDSAYRRRSLGSACLEYAVREAQARGCYKVMLMTSSKEEGTLNFYRKAGFDSQEKTAFIRRLGPRQE